MPRKYLSGFEKRKKKQRIDNLIQSQARALDKFFCDKKQPESSSLVEDVESEEQINLGNKEQEDLGNENEEDLMNEKSNECLDDSDNENMDDGCQNEEMNFECGPRNIDDPSNWDQIDQKFIDFIVERGPIRINEHEFPIDSLGRHFSSAHHVRYLPKMQEE